MYVVYLNPLKTSEFSMNAHFGTISIQAFDKACSDGNIFDINECFWLVPGTFTGDE